MKEKRDEKKKQDNFLDTPLKRGFDKVYQMILANGLFILMNLHILLVFLFIEPGNIVLFYMMLGILSLNVAPSYGALVRTLKLPAREDQKVMKDYFIAYKQNFLVSFSIGILGIFLMVNLLSIGIFFLAQDMLGLNRIFQGLFFLILAFTVMFTYIGGVVKVSFGETLKIGSRNMIPLLPGAAAAVTLGVISLFIGGLFRVVLIVGFSLGATVQNKLSERTINKIKTEEI